jgi:hypothetical protein
MLAVGIAVVSGCGGGSHFANKPKPAIPVNLTVYINNSRVSVSPSSVGAGPVVFVVTNQASNAESLTISPSGNPSQPLANTGPINPQATAQVTVNFGSPGNYTIAAGPNASNDAAAATTHSIQSAALHIGPTRSSSSNLLYQP